MMIESSTYRDIDQQLNSKTVAVIPVGSIEQHGLHAPLGTDLYIAEELANAVDQMPDVLVLPAIPVGISDYHRHFTGSLWVRAETLKQYIYDILISLRFHGINKVVLVNGHGGNRESLKEMARQLEMTEETMQIVVWTWFESIEQEIVRLYGYRPPLHADEAETAMLYALKPKLVRTELYEESASGASPIWGVFHDGTMISQVVSRFSKSGATGDPRKTDPKQGELFRELSIHNLKGLIEYLQSR